MTPDVVITACREMLPKIERKHARLNEKLNFMPVLETIKLHEETAKFLRLYGQTAPETITFLQDAQKLEKKINRIARWQKKNKTTGYDELFLLEKQIDDLRCFIAREEIFRSKYA